MLELVLIFSLVMNIMQFFWHVSMSGERRHLNDQIRWLQQQIEQMQQERAPEFASGGSSLLLIFVVLVAMGIGVWMLISRTQ